MRTVAPTKTNLLKLKDELKFARLGHELLDQKRNILIIELLTLVDQTIDFQGRVDKALAEAYSAFEDAVLDMGKLEVAYLGSSVNIDANIKLKARRVMGVQLPVVDTEFIEQAPYYSPLGTSFRIDSAVQEFKEALKIMGRFAELKVSVTRLAHEVKKTIRRSTRLKR
jgi:V/A-type H+-transporting ATPase subunit D